jgi:triosephosphate isomerase
MSHGPKSLIAGNWKMNGLRANLLEISLMGAHFGPELRLKTDLMICPPSPLLGSAVEQARGTGIAIGAQDCHAKYSGAHTGDVSANMIFDCGAMAVIVGHSERRIDHAERDHLVAAKAQASMDIGLQAIVCIGETKAEREAGRAISVVRRQLKGSVPLNADPAKLVIAYEPVWAIGTGLTPTNADILEVHAAIRADLKRRFGKAEGSQVRILYGGSVKPNNAREILALDNVNGALVGGASLKAADFMAIAAALV